MPWLHHVRHWYRAKIEGGEDGVTSLTTATEQRSTRVPSDIGRGCTTCESPRSSDGSCFLLGALPVRISAFVIKLFCCFRHRHFIQFLVVDIWPQNGSQQPSHFTVGTCVRSEAQWTDWKCFVLSVFPVAFLLPPKFWLDDFQGSYESPADSTSAVAGFSPRNLAAWLMKLLSLFLRLVYFEGLSLLQLKSLSPEEHMLFEMISLSV